MLFRSRAAKEQEKEFRETAKRSPIVSRLGYWGTTLGLPLVGWAAIQALRAPAIIPEAVSGGQRLLQALKTGGIVGGVGGALQPTTEEEAAKFAKQKATQVGVGAGLGAILGPLIAGVPAAYEITKQTIRRALGREEIGRAHV